MKCDHCPIPGPCKGELAPQLCDLILRRPEYVKVLPDDDYPSLLEQASNLAGAMGRVVHALAHGEPIHTTPEEAEHRRMACMACEHHDPVQERCRQCGCYLSLKVWLIREHCPLDPPKW